MNLDLLRTFLAVIRAGGMRRAAAGLHLTQPAVSARIRELEARLEAPLFERVGRRLVPTAAGRFVAAEAPALLAAADALLRRAQELASSGRGTLRLATIDAASIYVLPEIYRAFRDAHPGVQLLVQVVDSRRVLAAVQSLECDVGVLALPAADADVECVPIFAEELICVAVRGHPLAARGPRRLAEVASQPLVLYGQGSVTRELLDGVFAAHDIEPNVAMETASPDAMKRLAEVGVGITIVPQPLVEAEIAAGRLQMIPLADARFVRRLATAVRRGRSLSGAAANFLSLVHRRYPPLDQEATESETGSAVSGGPRRRRPRRR